MVDFPGRLAVTAYTMGCNFRCPICHNRELALSLSDGLPDHGTDAVLEVTRAGEGWIDGICVTGGEPLLHTDIATVLERFKTEGLAVKLDTNGSFPRRLEKLLHDGLVDYVAMDLKAPLTDAEYSQAAGVSAAKWLPKLRRSIDIIRDADVDHEFRTICIPGIHLPEVIGRTARAISPCKRYVLRAFRPVNTLAPEYERVPPPTEEQMCALLAAARAHIPEAVVS
jgi:pyruvate formate lyase activating enzyme